MKIIRDGMKKTERPLQTCGTFASSYFARGSSTFSSNYVPTDFVPEDYMPVFTALCTNIKKKKKKDPVVLELMAGDIFKVLASNMRDVILYVDKTDQVASRNFTKIFFHSRLNK